MYPIGQWAQLNFKNSGSEVSLKFTRLLRVTSWK